MFLVYLLQINNTNEKGVHRARFFATRRQREHFGFTRSFSAKGLGRVLNGRPDARVLRFCNIMRSRICAVQNKETTFYVTDTIGRSSHLFREGTQDLSEHGKSTLKRSTSPKNRDSVYSGYFCFGMVLKQRIQNNFFNP